MEDVSTERATGGADLEWRRRSMALSQQHDVSSGCVQRGAEKTFRLELGGIGEQQRAQFVRVPEKQDQAPRC